MPAKRIPPWKKPAPRKKKSRRTLTSAHKAAAKQRAERSGRHYPNLVDNMWAVRQPKK